MITLNFQAAIDNASLQIGDIAYYKSLYNDSIFSLGAITSISEQSMKLIQHIPLLLVLSLCSLKITRLTLAVLKGITLK